MQEITHKLEQVQQQVTDLIAAVNKAKPNYIGEASLSLYSPINTGEGPKLMVEVYTNSYENQEIIDIEEFSQYCENIIERYKHKGDYIIVNNRLQKLVQVNDGPTGELNYGYAEVNTDLKQVDDTINYLYPSHISAIYSAQKVEKKMRTIVSDYNSLRKHAKKLTYNFSIPQSKEQVQSLLIGTICADLQGLLN